VARLAPGSASPSPRRCRNALSVNDLDYAARVVIGRTAGIAQRSALFGETRHLYRRAGSNRRGLRVYDGRLRGRRRTDRGPAPARWPRRNAMPRVTRGVRRSD
jgi:hypothetical protein